MSLVNRYNFLRWDDGEASASIESDIPNGYEQDRNRCDYKPLLIAGESMRFYINALEGLTDVLAIGDTHTLDLVNAVTGAIQVANVSPLQVHSFTTAAGDVVQTLYCSLIIDGTVPVGDYVLKVMDGATTYLTSNIITVMATTTDYKSYSVLAKFRHDRYFYGINYQDLESFYQQFRLHFNMIDIQQEEDRNVYFEVTTGKPREYEGFLKELIKIEAYYFDGYAHEAAGLMFKHREVYLNLKQYVAKASYKRNWDQRSKVYKGEIELYKDEFSSVNRCNTVAV